MKTMIKKLSFALSILTVGSAALRAEQPATPAPAPAAPPPPAATATATANVENTNGVGARIKFEMPIYDFGKAKSGDPVKYTFIFTNTGDAVLELTSVQPHCGCTTSGEWSHKVDPGQTGSIPIQVNSANLQGPITKTVTVNCNDKTQPSITLQIKGTIWKPIEVNPQFAVLNIPVDSPESASTVVKVINNMEEPVTLSAPESNNKSFQAVLKTNQPGKEYEVTIKPVPPLAAGSVQGQITLKTSSTNVPVVTVTAWANVQPALAVMPPQITLPGGPLNSKTTPTITIQNNSTNLVTLSDPAITAKDVDVQLKEMIPGKSFNATLSFPQGFQISQGQQVEFTVKSSNPNFPVIKVPVNQMPPPPPPPAQAPKAPPTASVTPAPPAAPRPSGQ